MVCGKAENEVMGFYHQGLSNRKCWDRAWEGCCVRWYHSPLGFPVSVLHKRF